MLGRAVTKPPFSPDSKTNSGCSQTVSKISMASCNLRGREGRGEGGREGRRERGREMSGFVWFEDYIRITTGFSPQEKQKNKQKTSKKTSKKQAKTLYLSDN